MATYLGVIPARDGSKRLPNKNLININNRPLIYWTITAAKKSKLLNDVVVSTEDKEINRVANFYKTRTIDRPKELTDDNVSVLDVLMHVMQQEKTFDYVVLLLPTNPMRVNNIIDKCIKKVEETKADSLATGFDSKQYEWTAKGHDPLGSLANKKGWFYNDGCVEIHSRKYILKHKSYGKNNIKYYSDEVHHEDIDTKWDLIKTEAVMKEWERLHGKLF